MSKEGKNELINDVVLDLYHDLDDADNADEDLYNDIMTLLQKEKYLGRDSLKLQNAIRLAFIEFMRIDLEIQLDRDTQKQKRALK